MKYDFCKPCDKHHFPQQIVPTAMLIIDDMASTPIYTNSLGELVNLQMKNRHYKMSVFNLVQAYKLCPRSIRLNSSVMMLFPCKSKKMILEFADTCYAQYTPEDFLKLYDYATMDSPHSFLYIDCRVKDGFRKNFNKTNIDYNIIMSTEGDYFATRDEAISFYKSNFKNLEDKPDWLVDSMIDFAIRYPRYNEYIEVERKVKNHIPLTEYEKKEYGELDWDKKLRSYKKNEIIPDMVDIMEQGEYLDIGRDTVARESMNKYGLDFGKQLEPDRRPCHDAVQY
jgi:hypothetical protein